jgi:hypothetical protein
MDFLKITTAFAVIGIVGFFGCNSGSSPTGPAITDSSIIGIWNVINSSEHVTETYNGTTMRIDTTETFSGTNTANFKSDNTFIFLSENGNTLSTAKRIALAKIMTLDTLTGTWSLSGNQLTLISTASTFAATASISGNTLTLSTQIDTTETYGAEAFTIRGSSVMTMTKQ